MFRFLLNAIVLTFVMVQGQKIPQHVLFTPSTYSPGAVETLTISIYNDSISQLSVNAELTYTECKCTWYYQSCGKNYSLYSRDSGIFMQGKPVKLKIQMPELADLPDRQYYLTVSAANGSIIFLKSQYVSLTSSDYRGYLFVKTDKPIYKPSQTVKFCIVSVDKNFIPYSATVDIKITDARSSHWTIGSRDVMKWEGVTIEESGIKCLEFPLSDEPRFGVWSIFVDEKIDRGTCGYHWNSQSRNETCRFEVKEYILPRFSVQLSGPNRIERNDTEIRGMVSAKYTFGEPVLGTVTLNFTLESSGRKESLMFKQIVASLIKGKYSFTVSTEEYRRITRYSFDPFCEKSTIKVTAEVTENGRGTTQSTDTVIPHVANRVTLSFADRAARIFRPGLPYTVRVKATYPDGSPAKAVPIKIVASINNNKKDLFDGEMVSNQSGMVEVTVLVPSRTSCLQIKAELAVMELPSCEEAILCASPAPVYSPSRSFLQVTEKIYGGFYQVGQTATFVIQSTVPLNNIHIMAISRANIVNYTTIATATPAQTETEFTISITHDLVPSFKLLSFFVGEDGELIADLIEVNVKCELKEKVNIHFTKDFAEPGENITVSATADANTPVLIGIIDTSLMLLAESCKSLQSSSICERLGSLTSGSLSSIDNTCSTESNSQCCSSTCKEPTQISSKTLFQLAGVSMRSNMIQLPTTTVQPPIYRGWSIRFDSAPVMPRGDGDIPLMDDAPVIPEHTPVSEESHTRTFFPETWKFLVAQTNSTGRLSIDATVPDTITSWVAEAFSISQRNGLGISPPTTLTVVKPFFISLELPFSVNYEEEVSIVVLIFNFNSESVNARISVEIDDSLALVNNVTNMLRIEPNSSKSFVMRLKMLGVGNLPIKITATSSQANAQDSVQKLLFVKPGCTKQVNTTNMIITGKGKIESSILFDFSKLPTCYISGSHKASISVTGDIASPPNLANLLVLPSGCGEQNLVKLALNTVVAKYLQQTVGLPEHTAARVRFNLQTGYQRQLNYQARRGYFSIWSRGRASLWLTAAAVQVFSEIPKIGDESITIVDHAVGEAAVRYLIQQQQQNGAFPIIGQVHNHQLMDNEFALTAFTLRSLKSYASAFDFDRVVANVVKGYSYLVKNWRNSRKHNTTLCSYGLAIAASVLASNRRSISEKMLIELKSRIQSQTDGTCFICNDCGDDNTENEQCSGPSQSNGASSTCIETTAYTLLALIDNEDTDNIICLSSWLAKQKNKFSVFSSSQDTVVAITALTRVANLIFSQNLSLNVVLDLPGDEASHRHQLTHNNRYTKQTYEINNIGQAKLKWSGNGTAIVQAVLEYYGCNCCQKSQAFDLTINATFDRSGGDVAHLKLKMCFKYNAGNHSNMALLDFEVPSGYVYQSWNYVSKKPSISVQRTDKTGNGALLYIDEISGNQECIEAVAIMAFKVNNYASPPVTIYDYYTPGQAVIKYYKVKDVPSVRK